MIIYAHPRAHQTGGKQTGLSTAMGRRSLPVQCLQLQEMPSDTVCRGCLSPLVWAVRHTLASAALTLSPPAAVQASAQGIDFQAADVFFSLCMLQLPQQSLATFFVRSVQSSAELAASLDRMAPLLASEDRKQMPERKDLAQEGAASSLGLKERSHRSMGSVETQPQEVRLGMSSLCACLRFLSCLLRALLLQIYCCSVVGAVLSIISA